MEKRAIITSASTKYFPSLMNLLGSIESNYPNHPKIFIYDLGLAWPFAAELKQLPNVEVLNIPPFVPFWRSCYTWKTYIFAHPVAEANFYLDAGCQVLRPLDSIFEEIEQKSWFLIGQGGRKFSDIVPKSYKSEFGLSDDFDEMELLHAGEFGFAAYGAVRNPIEFAFEQAKLGKALGFSEQEQWRNKGANKNNYVRDCLLFRHDMTLLNIAFRKEYGRDLVIHPESQYAGGKGSHPEQYIWQIRLGFRKLDYLNAKILHKTPTFLARLNRFIIAVMIGLKNINLSIKKKLAFA